MPARLLSFCCLTVFALLAQGSQVRANCGDNPDCPKGYECQTQTVNYGCAGGAPTPEPCPPDDQKCLEEQKQQPADDQACDETEVEVSSCVAKECATDADCAAGMVCFQQKVEQCSSAGAAPCAPGEKCPEPEPAEPTCETVDSPKACIPRYVLPCETASDCGAGFECEPVLSDCTCGSSGSGGDSGGGSDPGAGDNKPGFAPPAPAADAGIDTDDVPPGDSDFQACDCGETKALVDDGEKYCKAQEIDCDSASECPADWTCEQRNDIAVTNCASQDRKAASGDAGAIPDCTQPEPQDLPNHCVPPFGNLFGRDVSANDGKGIPEDGELTGGGTAAPQADDADEDHGTDADAGVVGGGKGDDSNCSVIRVHGASDAPSAGWLLTLGALGLVLAARRRARSAR